MGAARPRWPRWPMPPADVPLDRHAARAPLLSGRPAAQMDDLEPLGGLAVGLGMRGEIGDRGGEPAPAERAAGRAREGCWSRPSRAGRRPAGAARRSGPSRGSQSATGRAKPARLSRSPAARTSIWGWICGRGLAAFAPLRRRASRSQPRQAARAGEGGEEQAVGPQRPPDQGSAPGRSLTLSSAPDRDDEVEGGVGEGQAVLVALHAAGARGERGAGIGGDHVEPALAQAAGQIAAAAAEIERVARKARWHRPSRSISSSAARRMEIIGAGAARRGAVAAQPAQAPVERLVLDARPAPRRRYSKAGRPPSCPPPDRLSGFRTFRPAARGAAAARRAGTALAAGLDGMRFYASAWPRPTCR